MKKSATKKPQKVVISFNIEKTDLDQLMNLNPNMLQENLRQAVKLFLIKSKDGKKVSKSAPEVIADAHNDLLTEDHLLNSIEQ